MKINHVCEELQKLFRLIILENECSGNESHAYKFSDPDGKNGRSGWSFGICQYDINFNANALSALREMSFTTDEVAALKRQDADMKAMDTKLRAHSGIVDEWDRRQLDDCIYWSLKLCEEINVDFSKLETFVHIADYENQMRFSRGGKLYQYLKGIKEPVTPVMILGFKLNQTEWGKKRADDVERRYRNIQKLTTIESC